MLLRFIEDQNETICLEAVSQNGLALQYVKDQTGKICIAAVKQNGQALQFVRNQTEEICMFALSSDISNKSYITISSQFLKEFIKANS